MSVSLVVTAAPNPAEPEAMATYIQAVGPMLVGGGGEVIRRVMVSSVESGDPDYRMVLVVDFPDEEAVRAVLTSEAYQALIPARDKGFDRIDISIAKAP